MQTKKDRQVSGDGTRSAELSHLDEQGKARMVDVTQKEETSRRAKAIGLVRMQPETLQKILNSEMKKGDVLAVARIAGIQAAKKCADLIPLCHPLPITGVDISFEPDGDQAMLKIVAECRVKGPTGVEMEALTAVSVSALTIYDMCKAVDKGMVITDIRLLEKSGGKSGDYRYEDTQD